MREEGKISAYQAMVYQVSIVLATAILFVPAITTKHAKQDAWLSVIIACFFGSLQIYTAVSLARRFPNASVVQYAPLILGKVPGKVVGFVYLFYFFYVGYFILQEFAALMSSSYMPLTPSIVFMLVLSLLAVYAAYGGLEVICRMSSVVLTVVLATMALIVLLIVKDIKIWRFLPVLENGFNPILLGAISPGAWFGETAVILMLYPFINNKEKVVKTSLLAILTLFIAMEVVVTGAIGLLGPTETASFLFPTFNMVRRIKLEALPFLERLDALFMMIWVAGMLIKLTTFFLSRSACPGAVAQRQRLSPVNLTLHGHNDGAGGTGMEEYYRVVCFFRRSISLNHYLCQFYNHRFSFNHRRHSQYFHQENMTITCGTIKKRKVFFLCESVL